MGTVVILGWADRKGLTGKMTFEQKPEGEKASHLDIWGRSVQAKGRAAAKLLRKAR